MANISERHQRIINSYKEGLTIANIINKHKVSVHTIYKILQIYNVPRKNLGSDNDVESCISLSDSIKDCIESCDREERLINESGIRKHINRLGE